MPTALRTALLCAALLAALLCSGPAAAADTQLILMIPVPGAPLASYDISWIDQQSQTYYLADRSNAGIDIIDAKSHEFVARIPGFVGFTGNNDTSGPDGVVVNGHTLYAGDGDSTVKVIDLRTRQIINVVNTGGVKRADEMAVDPNGKTLLAVNNADDPAFLTLISTKKGNPILFSHVTVPGATGGIEQPVWDKATKRYYISIPQLNGSLTDGGVAVFNPKTGMVETVHPIANCQPSGLTLGPNQHLLLGCAANETTVIDAKTGTPVAHITQVTGSDEVWFNSGDNRYYTASRNNPGGPVLGVIDALTNQWIQNVPTAPNSHSVAANARNNEIFVPLTASPASPCPNGCIGVFEDVSSDKK